MYYVHGRKIITIIIKLKNIEYMVGESEGTAARAASFSEAIGSGFGWILKVMNFIF